MINTDRLDKQSKNWDTDGKGGYLCPFTYKNGDRCTLSWYHHEPHGAVETLKKGW